MNIVLFSQTEVKQNQWWWHTCISLLEWTLLIAVGVEIRSRGNGTTLKGNNKWPKGWNAVKAWRPTVQTEQNAPRCCSLGVPGWQLQCKGADAGERHYTSCGTACGGTPPPSEPLVRNATVAVVQNNLINPVPALYETTVNALEQQNALQGANPAPDYGALRATLYRAQNLVLPQIPARHKRHWFRCYRP